MNWILVHLWETTFAVDKWFLLTSDYCLSLDSPLPAGQCCWAQTTRSIETFFIFFLKRHTSLSDGCSNNRIIHLFKNPIYFECIEKHRKHFEKVDVICFLFDDVCLSLSQTIHGKDTFSIVSFSITY